MVNKISFYCANPNQFGKGHGACWFGPGSCSCKCHSTKELIQEVDPDLEALLAEEDELYQKGQTEQSLSTVEWQPPTGAFTSDDGDALIEATPDWAKESFAKSPKEVILDTMAKSPYCKNPSMWLNAHDKCQNKFNGMISAGSALTCACDCHCHPDPEMQPQEYNGKEMKTCTYCQHNIAWQHLYKPVAQKEFRKFLKVVAHVIGNQQMWNTIHFEMMSLSCPCCQHGHCEDCGQSPTTYAATCSCPKCDTCGWKEQLCKCCKKCGQLACMCCNQCGENKTECGHCQFCKKDPNDCYCCVNCGSKDLTTCGCSSGRHGSTTRPPWEKRGIKVRNRAPSKRYNDVWGFESETVDICQAAADFYLLESMAAAMLDPMHTFTKHRTPYQAVNSGLEHRISELTEQAEARLAELLEWLDPLLVKYTHCAVSGELRHHKAIGGSILNNTREVAWAGWKDVYKAVGPQALVDAASLFREFSHGSFGGERWATAAEVLYMRLTSTHHKCEACGLSASGVKGQRSIQDHVAMIHQGEAKILHEVKPVVHYEDIYGGDAVIKCCDEHGEFQVPGGTIHSGVPDLPPVLFVDRVFNLQHNGGVLLNKVQWDRHEQTGWGLENLKSTVLPAHASNPVQWETLLAAASPGTQSLFRKAWRAGNRWRVAEKFSTSHAFSVLGESPTMIPTPGEKSKTAAQVRYICSMCSSNPMVGHRMKCTAVQQADFTGQTQPVWTVNSKGGAEEVYPTHVMVVPEAEWPNWDWTYWEQPVQPIKPDGTMELPATTKVEVFAQVSGAGWHGYPIATTTKAGSKNWKPMTLAEAMDSVIDWCEHLPTKVPATYVQQNWAFYQNKNTIHVSVKAVEPPLAESGAYRFVQYEVPASWSTLKDTRTLVSELILKRFPKLVITDYTPAPEKPKPEPKPDIDWTPQAHTKVPPGEFCGHCNTMSADCVGTPKPKPSKPKPNPPLGPPKPKPRTPKLPAPKIDYTIAGTDGAYINLWNNNKTTSTKGSKKW